MTKSIGSKHVDENEDGLVAVAAAAVTETIPSKILFGIQPAVLVVLVGDVSAVSYYWNGCAMTLWASMVVLEKGIHSPGFGQDNDGMRRASVLDTVMI